MWINVDNFCVFRLPVDNSKLIHRVIHRHYSHVPSNWICSVDINVRLLCSVVILDCECTSSPSITHLSPSSGVMDVITISWPKSFNLTRSPILNGGLLFIGCLLIFYLGYCLETILGFNASFQKQHDLCTCFSGVLFCHCFYCFHQIWIYENVVLFIFQFIFPSFFGGNALSPHHSYSFIYSPCCYLEFGLIVFEYSI